MHLKQFASNLERLGHVTVIELKIQRLTARVFVTP